MRAIDPLAITPEAPPAERLIRGVFLVVEAMTAMRQILAGQLRRLGADEVLEAATGEEALRILTERRVALVISEWNMPGMSGLELLKALRARPALAALPYLLITADIARDGIQQAIDAGVTDLLAKPYTLAELAERLGRALHGTARGQADIVQGAVRSTRGTILVVDDTPDNLDLLAGLFRDTYRVKVAQSGEKALAICQSDTPPDLVLLDVMMPDMNGFEVARRLREHPSSEQIPVIFVTALTDADSRSQGLELGAVDFVSKPIDAYTLTMRVRNFMRYVELHQRLQSDFDSMMSASRLREDVEHIIRHDMKGPLAGGIGLIRALSNDANLTDRQRKFLGLAEESILQSLDMINLSSELYKIETGRFQLNAKPVDLADLLQRLAAINMRAFARRKIAIDLHTPAPDATQNNACSAQGDETLCYSLFQNLIKNACEAAPDGSTVSITLAPGETGAALCVAIENAGVVPESIRTSFFEKFATAGKEGGTGIGTYSARLLTEAQQGRIAMETSDATGKTCISVTLPTR